MSIQIAVRLPDELVAFIDREVSANRAPSRAAVVLRALEREQRRRIAARDAAILAATEPDQDLDALAEFSAKLATDIDDIDDID
jgi:Arc/MetJ-type ribon-helix-helix transcriptional regulator